MLLLLLPAGNGCDRHAVVLSPPSGITINVVPVFDVTLLIVASLIVDIDDGDEPGDKHTGTVF